MTQICAQLDGLPLGIELAAGRSRLLTPSALLSRLDSALGISGREVDRPERHQTLRSTIAWSHDLLTPELQKVFRRLAVLKGGDLDAVAAVVETPADDDPLDAIADLVDVNLVSIAGGIDDEPRVDMLGTVRAFALERLTQDDDVDACRRRHAEYYADLVEGLLPQLDLIGQHPVTRGRLESELPNVRDGASKWAVASGGDDWEPDRIQIGLRLAADLSMYSRRSRRQPDVRGWLEQVIALAGDDEGPEMALALMEMSVHEPAGPSPGCRCCDEPWRCTRRLATSTAPPTPW